jgi:hypothetical protein
MPNLASVLLSGEIPMILTEYLDPASAIDLTRTCSQIYLSIPRNSALGISIWRRFLLDERFTTNRLVADISKELVLSDMVSRSNFKLLVCVLSQKNGFMKISRLKSLLAKGRLSSPLLPHKGQWKCLTRLDQFALRRASKDTENQPRSNEGIALIPTSSESTGVRLLSRISGRKGRTEMVKTHLANLLKSDYSSSLPSLFSLLMKEGNYAGAAEIIEMGIEIIGVESLNNMVSDSNIGDARSILGDTFLHSLLRDRNTSVSDKLGILRAFLDLPYVCGLLNITNHNHETVLILSQGIGGTLDPKWRQMGAMLIEKGADASICDKKGNFYVN